MKLIVKRHFIDRYRERVDSTLTDKQIKTKVCGRFYSGMRRGLKTNKKGQLKLYLYNDVIAIIEPNPRGFYLARTVIVNRKKEYPAVKIKSKWPQNKYRRMMEHVPSLEPNDFKGE